MKDLLKALAIATSYLLLPAMALVVWKTSDHALVILEKDAIEDMLHRQARPN